MKKILTFLLAVTMTTSLLAATACGGETTPTTKASTAKESSGASNASEASGLSSAPTTGTDLLDTLPLHLGPTPDTIDPALNISVDGGSMVVHAFEGLYVLDKDGIPVPGQAESVDISEDSLTYTFTLRDGLKWSDGEPLTAQDFVYSWNRVIDPATAADYEYMFAFIEGYEEKNLAVKALDDKTLEVKLKAITPFFLEICAFPVLSPVRQDIVEANPDGWATKPETYICNGPYILKELVNGSHATYQKNPNYWNYEALGTEFLNFKFIEEFSSILNAFVNGEILFGEDLPQAEIDAWKDKPEFGVLELLGTYYLSFNTEVEALQNPLVRQALTLAIDRNFIVEQIGKAGQVPAAAMIPPTIHDADPKASFREVGGYYYDLSEAGYEANVAKAKELLVEAGYPEGKGLPTLEYSHNISDLHQQIAQALQHMWGEIGVQVTIASQEWSTFLNTRTNGDFEIARDGWLADYNDPITFLDMFYSTSANNNPRWKNPEFDKLIDEIRKTSDIKTRFELMHEAEDLLMKEWPFSPIFYYTDPYLISQNLKDFYVSPLGFKYFMYATASK